ncbi:hypothetical protein STEG23_010990, partial [Scotinomys teguina]
MFRKKRKERAVDKRSDPCPQSKIDPCDYLLWNRSQKWKPSVFSETQTKLTAVRNFRIKEKQ